jgi:acyl-CoA thioesterase I
LRFFAAAPLPQQALLGLQAGSPVRLVALNLDWRRNEMRATILALPLVVFLAIDATAQVVALGTSGTRGIVSSDEAWTTLLERMLRAKGANVSVSNEGVFGDTSDGLLGRLDSAAPEGTRVVIIECCGNDNKKGRSVANTPGNVSEMVRRVRKRGAEVVFLGPPELGEVASRFGARYCGKLNAGVPHEHMIGKTGAMHADAAGNSVIAAHVFPCVAAALRKS